MHKKERVFIITVVLVFSVSLIAGCATSPKSESVSDEELGIRKQTLFSEQEVMPFKGVYPDVQPGESERFQRAFENSPPLIPHDLTGMLPIAVTNNMCKGCHMPEVAKGMGAIPVPRSHMMDLETGKDLGGELDGKRYNCMQCHVPQVTLPAPIKNMFEGDFRDERSKYNSNLADTLNEGVEADK